jgi:mannose-6-phosphate isomerase-like protein (cupin superfamily)
MTDKKYGSCVYQLEPETNDLDWKASPQAYFRGKAQIPGAKMNTNWAFILKPVLHDKEWHTHKVDEYITFLGGNFPDVFDFDAEIEFCMGAEEEKFVITAPTTIHIPAGVPHGPLNFRRVDKPVFFQYALMSGSFNIVTKDGQEIWWEGPNRLCCYDNSKKCVYCNKCVGDTATPDALGT